MNSAGAGFFPATLLIMKSIVPLKTIPVGIEVPFTPGALGITTGEGGVTISPFPIKRTAVPVSALFTHHGLLADRARPHVFLRLAARTGTPLPSTFAPPAA